MLRKTVLLGVATVTLLAVSSPSQQTGPRVTVYKLASCGCCGKWVEHLKANGFTVKVLEVNDTSGYERQYHVPRSMQSCHTAVVNGYTIEGHVPAADIKRVLSERPKAVGLSVPGMPVGSPGMEGDRTDPYSVLMFDESGRSSVYARHETR